MYNVSRYIDSISLIDQICKCGRWSARAGPRGVVYGGGGTSSRRLEPSGASNEWGESMRGGLNPPLIRGGYGGPPPKFFKKSMSLRMHFEPF